MPAESIQALMDRVFELINEEEYEEAIKVGRKLKSRRHKSAFEILALAYGGLGDKKQAIEFLRTGISIAPQIWLFWQLLGNYRSDLKRYASAYKAYQRALKCPDVSTSSVHLNIAIALSREGRLDEASRELKRVTDPDLRMRAAGVRLGILIDREEFEKAIKVGENTLPGFAPDVDAEVMASILTNLANAYRLGRGNKERAAEFARGALKHKHAYRSALWILRELNRQTSKNAKYFRLLLEGDWADCAWPVPGDRRRRHGFVIMYDVVADTPEEGLAYARQCEPEDMRESLRVEECENLGRRPRTPKGVYDFGGHILFPRRAAKCRRPERKKR